MSSSSIVKTTSGYIDVVYNKAKLNKMDERVLKLAFQDYGHLIRMGQQLTFSAFAAMIEHNSSDSVRVDVIKDVLHRAATTMRVWCCYEDDYYGRSEAVIIEVENWLYLPLAISKLGNVNNVHTQVISSCFVVGRFTIDAKAQVVSR